MRLLRVVTVVSVLGWLGLLAAPVPWVIDTTLPTPGYGMGMVLLVGVGATLLAMVAVALPERAAVRVGLVPAVISAVLCAWMWSLVAVGSADPAVQEARVEGRGRNEGSREEIPSGLSEPSEPVEDGPTAQGR